MTNSIKNFKSTYLYIKQHSITGKLYFGKTFSNPENYYGSGTKWKNHIAYHGKEHIKTLWYCLFYDEYSIKEFALMCSEQWDIVNSNEWLNLICENGINSGGGMTGKHHSIKSRRKMSRSRTGKKATDEARRNMSLAGGHPQLEETKEKIRKTLTGVKHSAERCETISNAKIGKVAPRRQDICPHCDKIGDISLLKRWHFDNCKKNPNNINIIKTLTCPHCNKIGCSAAMKRWHFDNCKKNPNNENIKRTKSTTCPHCNKTGGISNMTRYHFDNCKYKL